MLTKVFFLAPESSWPHLTHWFKHPKLARFSCQLIDGTIDVEKEQAQTSKKPVVWCVLNPSLLSAVQTEQLQQLKAKDIVFRGAVKWLEHQCELTAFEFIDELTLNISLDDSSLKNGMLRKKILEFLVIAVFSPILVLGYGLGLVLASLDGKFQPYYRSQRIGKDNQPFGLIKFRTMHLNAFSKDTTYSLPGDARITGAGKLLRALKLDELSQLLNVLRGEMHLIGPRPEIQSNIEHHLTKIIPFYDRRHVIAPGISGWAQANTGYPREAAGFVKRHSADLYYLRRWTLLLDLRILWKTFRLVIDKVFSIQRPLQTVSQWDINRLAGIGVAQTGQSLVVAIKQQTMTWYRQDQTAKTFRISTASKGIGQEEGSFQTPLGLHIIDEIIGKDQPEGSVFKGRQPTGEIQPVTKKDVGDVITSRILRLRGLDLGVNAKGKVDSYDRFIYIHGTPYEHDLGKPSSAGCIRVANQDIIELASQLTVNSHVLIIEDEQADNSKPYDLA